MEGAVDQCSARRKPHSIILQSFSSDIITWITREALFGVGAAGLLLLIGIHNAWDSIAYLVFYSKQNKV
jgi:hypothetical protein